MYKYLLIILLFLSSCENPLTNDEEINCALDYNGFYDNCGICSGGTSGHIANSEQDCNGICKCGTALFDLEIYFIIESFNKFGSIEEILYLFNILILSISTNS